jgi:hypothetical protein
MFLLQVNVKGIGSPGFQNLQYFWNVIKERIFVYYWRRRTLALIMITLCSCCRFTLP